MGIIDEALDRQATRPAPRQIDYERMRRVGPSQKAALTRAIKTKDAEKIAAVCKAAVAEWNEIGAWPDHWSRWQRACAWWTRSRPLTLRQLCERERAERFVRDITRDK